MVEFEVDLWRKRAWTRLEKSIKKEPGAAKREKVERLWYKDVLFINKIKTVVNWCSSKNIKVLFGKKPGGTYDTNLRTIFINSRSLPEKQLYYLLHECGHHLIGFTEHDERFGMGYPYVDDSDVNSTFQHRLACLEEEIEAWQRGWRLSKRLRLKLKRKDFDVVRLMCLRSYVQWANTRRLMKTV